MCILSNYSRMMIFLLVSKKIYENLFPLDIDKPSIHCNHNENVYSNFILKFSNSISRSLSVPKLHKIMQ